VPLAGVKDRVGEGDFRWVNRGGVDLLGANPRATTSAIGLPRAKTLYGPVPEQLRDPDSFVSRLKAMLAARREYRIAEGELLAVPEPKAAGVCVLVLKLPDHALAVTVLNFGRDDADEVVELPGNSKPPAGAWTDILTGRAGAAKFEAGRLRIRIPALSGTTFVPTPAR
jgi:maltose alpha-D-glucosyltransferase/alpha-amylase